jgi:hypothetical protein
MELELGPWSFNGAWMLALGASPSVGAWNLEVQKPFAFHRFFVTLRA